MRRRKRLQVLDLPQRCFDSVLGILPGSIRPESLRQLGERQ